MCLGIPGQIVEITDETRKLALVEVSGVKREVNVTCVVSDEHPLSSCVGDWVLIHVGFAMSRIDEVEAAATLKVLTELGEVQAELAAMRASLSSSRSSSASSSPCCLPAAIRSMTALPAQVFRMQARGVIRPGAYADIVIFDLDKLRDRATFDDPMQLSEGIVHVFVNGKVAVKNGELTGVLAGQVILRKERSKSK